jgi:hypothetical protein
MEGLMLQSGELYALGYIVVGILITVVAYRFPRDLYGKIMLGSLVAALFFSVSFIAWRIIVVPCPTVVALVLLAVDHLDPNYNPTGKNAHFYIAEPFLIQWGAWMSVLALASFLTRRRRAARDAQPQTY